MSTEQMSGRLQWTQSFTLDSGHTGCRQNKSSTLGDGSIIIWDSYNFGMNHKSWLNNPNKRFGKMLKNFIKLIKCITQTLHFLQSTIKIYCYFRKCTATYMVGKVERISDEWNQNSIWFHTKLNCSFFSHNNYILAHRAKLLNCFASYSHNEY